MSKSEILAELPKLKAEERTQVFERLCELQEDDLLRGIGPTEEEKNFWMRPSASSSAMAMLGSPGGRPCAASAHRARSEPSCNHPCSRAGRSSQCPGLV